MNNSLAARFHFSTLLLVLVISPPLFALAQSATTTGQAAKVLPAPGVSFEPYVRRYQADSGGISRFYNVPWSESRFDRLSQFYRDEAAQLKQVDFDALDQPGRVDYLLLRNKLNEELAHFTLEQRQLAEMNVLLPFRHAVQDLELARRRMEPVNSQASAETVAAIPDQIRKLRARIQKSKSGKNVEKSKSAEKADDKAKEATDFKDSKDSKDSTEEKDSKDQETKPEDGPPIKISPVLAKRTAEAVEAMGGTLHEWFAFYDGFQPEFSWWLKRPYDEAHKALEEYAKFLREDIAGLKGKDEDPLIGDPIGAQGLADDLAAENIPYTPEELIAIADQEFAWCESEMKKASREMGLGDDWKAALAKVKADYAPPGAQDELVTEISRQVIRFVKERGLVTIPPLCEETWRLTMSSPEIQKTLPFAAYGGQNMMVAYAKDEMKNEDKLMSMRGNNRHFIRIVVPHELIPGHHLQGFVAERNRTYRSLFRTPFLVEGWALYWEARLWELGYQQSPEDRIGMLFWRMHRCARIIISLKFHQGQMTPEEMVNFLVDRVGHEKFGATSEVRRYIGGDYSPLYQCAYMIGAKQLLALRKEIVETGRMTDKQFNDAVLACGAIPVEMIRAQLLNVPLTRDTQPNWQFAGPHPGQK